MDYPEMSLKQLAAHMAISVTTLKRRVRQLQRLKLLRLYIRPGRTYVFIPLVNQLPLSLLDAAQQPPLPDLPATDAVELDAHPASQWTKRGQQGRFVPVRDFHNIGQVDRSSVENLTDPHFDFQQVTGACSQKGSVNLTDHIGQLDRSHRSNRPMSGARTKEVQIKTKKENAAAGAAGLPLVGIPMTAEQRRTRSLDHGREGNYPVLLALALHVGRDPIEARRHLAVPIAEENDLRAATKSAASATPLRYDLQGPTGEGVMHAAVQVAWKILVREGRFAPDALFLRDQHARRRGSRS